MMEGTKENVEEYTKEGPSEGDEKDMLVGTEEDLSNAEDDDTKGTENNNERNYNDSAQWICFNYKLTPIHQLLLLPLSPYSLT